MKAGIVGSGIMGRLLAFLLINSGWQVSLFDQDANNNCSMAAAGLLNPFAELEKNDLIIFNLGEDSLNLWPKILNQLTNPIFFQRTGTIALAHPRDQAELTHFLSKIIRKLEHQSDYQKLNRDDIIKLEPEISSFHDGYYFPHEGQIDNQTLMHELEIYLENHNVCWLKNTFVTHLNSHQIFLDEKVHTFDLVLDCRGLGAKATFNDLRSVRGELIWLHAPDVNISRPIRFMHPRYSLYIAKRPNQIYVIGASEIESADSSPISVRTTLELLTAAYCVHANFSEARIIKTVTERRPTLTDHLPKIKYKTGLIAINGLYRHGFLLAPALAQDVMRFIQGGKTSIHYPQLWKEM